jgi:predicted Zn-dependent peptidase
MQMKKIKEINLKIFIKYCLFLLFFSICLSLFSNEDIVLKLSSKKLLLNNNLKLIYQEDHSSKITILQILINGGKKAESVGKKGLCYLTTRIVLELPDRSKIKKLMVSGSSFVLKVEGDYSIITLRSLSENFNESLELISKLIINPIFSSQRVFLIKKKMEFQQKQEEDNTLFLMLKSNFNSFFGEQGYGGSVYGSKETLKSIKKRDIVGFYKEHFNVSNMIISIVTDLKQKEIKDMFEKYFKKMPLKSFIKNGSTKFLIEAKENDSKKNRSISLKKDKKQTLISYTALLPGLDKENFVMAHMLENLMGKGVKSRLWILRDPMDLAYTVDAYSVQMKDSGLLSMYLKTDRKKREKAIKEIKKIIENLYKNGVNKEELNIAKIYSKADFLRENETKEIRALNLVKFEAMGLGFEFYDRFFSALESITLERFNQYIKKVLFSNNLIQVLIGPD